MEEVVKRKTFLERHSTDDKKLKAVDAILELEIRLSTAEREIAEYRKMLLGASEAYTELVERVDRISPKLILKGDKNWIDVK